MALDDAVYVDGDTGLRFLPVVVENSVSPIQMKFWHRIPLRTSVDDLRKDHDYVLIDFSPVAPIVDVRAATQIVDSFIYVIEWGRTQMNLVQHQLSGFPELYDRLLGVVLNKADVRVLERYETYYGKNYYGGQYPYLADRKK